MPKSRLCSGNRSRRIFLADTSMGLTGLALGSFKIRLSTWLTRISRAATLMISVIAMVSRGAARGGAGSQRGCS